LKLYQDFRLFFQIDFIIHALPRFLELWSTLLQLIIYNF
jgi:hypothetical protein